MVTSLTPTTSPSRKMGVPHAPKTREYPYLRNGDPIHFMFGFRIGFSGSADRMALFLVYIMVTSNPRWWPAVILENFEWPYLRNAWSDTLHVWFRAFRVGGSNGAISGYIKSKLAAGLQVGGRPPSWIISNSHIPATAHAIHLYTVFRKNTHSHFLSYLHEWCVDLNKNCSEYTQGKVDSDNVEIRYSLRPMTSLLRHTCKRLL